MTTGAQGDRLNVTPYFDILLQRLQSGDRWAQLAFGRHVHWGYWPEPHVADGSPEDYAAAAERLSRKVCATADIRDGMRILDVGCGLGGTLASLSERFDALRLVGVNIDRRQLRHASATGQPINHNAIRFVQADACGLPFAVASFDAVLAIESVFHFSSRSAFLAGAADSLAEGGSLTVTDFVPPAEALGDLRRFNAGRDDATWSSYGPVDVMCPVEQYRELAEAAGLVLLDCEDISRHTVPTYAFLRADQRRWPDRAAGRSFERATARLEMACRAGLLNYSILRFTRRAEAS